MQVLSEYYGENKTATVRKVTTNGNTLFEVMWGDQSVGVCATEQEADNLAENYALSANLGRG
tara:strand:- start:266 stop:451 length:186 start_codon:yes stop_codon:yes gene_type:complete